MKTSSCWGKPPARIYRFIEEINSTIGRNASVAIIGCSDGKFVFPFLRKGFEVTAIDFDKTALYGGTKIKPLVRNKITPLHYSHSETKIQYKEIPTQKINIHGLKKRAELEGLLSHLRILELDFYAEPPKETYDVLFTSCSLQYKSNRTIPIASIMQILKSHVRNGGYLYMDYMMPLEDSHDWKSDHFFRTGEIKKWFCDDWSIIHIKEMKKPVFESAHIDRPEDHFHRFGYILARRKR